MSRDYGAQFDFLETESVGRALDCLVGPPRQTAGPFHYLINEQAKSLLALQELQHEVGALLEFRDLVIETFPSLRTKLGATSVPMAHGSSPQRTTSTATSDWVPGVRVRRKLASSTSKKNDAVADSGFSTETSSKDTHSASSTAMQAASAGTADETEDELWSLLDLIHRKGTRLKEEVESLQDQLQQQRNAPYEEDFREAVYGSPSSSEAFKEIRKERDHLMRRMADMEAEVVASRIHTSRLQEDMEKLLATKQDLEEQLRSVMDERGEVNSRIHDLHAQFVSKSATESEKTKNCGDRTSIVAGGGGAKSPTTKKCWATKTCSTSQQLKDSRTSEERVAVGGDEVCDLDRLLGAEVPKVKVTNNEKFAAILAEKNPTVLQKHLLSSTVQNEILQKQLETASRLEVDLVDKLGKAREENEELKFQLEDKSIELEGTRAQVRILEQMQKGSPLPPQQHHDGPDVIPTSTLSCSTPTRGEILSASMRNMSPIPMTLMMDQSSSTESGHDQTANKKSVESVRRKPSKIPLKSYTAPKPPGRGKSHQQHHNTTSSARSRSGDSPSSTHSAHSKSIESLQTGPASKSGGGGSLPKSRNASLLVTSKDSLSSKLRSSDSLSKLSGNSSFGSRSTSHNNTSFRKSSTPNVKWTQGGNSAKDQTVAVDKVDSNQEKSPYRWNRSSYDDEKSTRIEDDDYLDSLDPNNSSSIHTQEEEEEDTSSHKFQTANTFTWNNNNNTKTNKEFYDSIDSNLLSSLYQQQGEELADCDSLEKHLSGNNTE